MTDLKAARQRSRPDTLRKILLAARHEFSQLGLSGGRIESIAREAGVTKQLIYYYYGSKVDLYEAVLQDGNDLGLSDLLSMDLTVSEPLAALRQIFGHFFDFYLEIPDLALLALDFNFHGSVHLRRRESQRKVLKLYEDIVDRAIISGHIVPGIDKRACFSFAMLIINGSFLHRDRAWGYAAPQGDEDEGEIAKRRRRALAAIMAIMTARDPELTGIN